VDIEDQRDSGPQTGGGSHQETFKVVGMDDVDGVSPKYLPKLYGKQGIEEGQLHIGWSRGQVAVGSDRRNAMNREAGSNLVRAIVICHYMNPVAPGGHGFGQALDPDRGSSSSRVRTCRYHGNV
jgi:hypothetical protein